MINKEQFFKDQKRIYEDNFGPRIVVEKGISPIKVSDRDGYAVVLRHPDNIIGPIANFSAEIAGILPAIVYGSDNIHTTIFLCGMEHRPASEHEMSQTIVDRLSEGVRNCEEDLSPVRIPYTNWLYNSNSVIAQGIAGEDFVNLADKTVYACRDIGEIRAPWGGHITASRFLEPKGSDDLEEFVALLERAPSVGISDVTYLDVIYLQLNSGEFTIETQDRFPLKQ